MWIDLETTGLDPDTGVVLEFAVVLCEDGRGDDFAIIAQYEGVIHHSLGELSAMMIDQVVEDMHRDNHLWSESQLSATTTAEVDEFLASLADSLTGGRKRVITLAGSSVHFDHLWCRRHFPRFAAYLSHRVFDVTTLRRAAEIWGSPATWPTRDTHRAMPDILASIDEARIARKALRCG
jgi:oligoribonuclease